MCVSVIHSSLRAVYNRWLYLLLNTQKSNRAVTESDPDSKVRQMAITLTVRPLSLSLSWAYGHGTEIFTDSKKLFFHSPISVSLSLWLSVCVITFLVQYFRTRFILLFFYVLFELDLCDTKLLAFSAKSSRYSDGRPNVRVHSHGYSICRLHCIKHSTGVVSASITCKRLPL